MTFYGWDTPDVVYLYSASGVFLRQVYSTMSEIRPISYLIVKTGTQGHGLSPKKVAFVMSLTTMFGHKTSEQHMKAIWE